MWRAWAWASGVLCSLVLYSGAARAECTKDVDCAGAELCEAGVCVSPPPAPAVTAAPAPSKAPAPSAPTPSPSPDVRAAMASEPRSTQTELPPEEPVRYKRRSRGLMAGGIVAASIGTLALLVAATTEGGRGCSGTSSQSCDREHNYGAWVLAGVLLGSGIPMIIVGSKKVPDTSTSSVALTPWFTLQGAGVGLRLAL